MPERTGASRAPIADQTRHCVPADPRTVDGVPGCGLPGCAVPARHPGWAAQAERMIEQARSQLLPRLDGRTGNQVTHAERAALAGCAEAGALAGELLATVGLPVDPYRPQPPCPTTAQASQLRALAVQVTGGDHHGAMVGMDALLSLWAVAVAGREAFETLVEVNLPLVRWLAGRRHRLAGHVGLSVDDLAGEGVVGLVRAVHKWDYRRGNTFATYATNWVVVFMRRALVRASGLSEVMYDLAREVGRAQGDLSLSLGRSATWDEVGTHLGLSGARVRQVVALAGPLMSLDAPSGGGRDDDGEGGLWERVAAGEGLSASVVDAARGVPDPTAAQALDSAGRREHEAVRRLVEALPERQRRVVSLAYALDGGQPLEPGQIAATLGVRESSVRAVLTDALARLRARAHTDPDVGQHMDRDMAPDPGRDGHPGHVRAAQGAQ